MEPSDEELGASSLSGECQMLLEDRRQWVLQEEVDRTDHSPANGSGGGWTQGQDQMLV